MAVPMQKRFSFQLWRLVLVLLKEFAQKKGLFGKPLRIFVIGKEVDQLISKDRATARFENDNRISALNFLLQSSEDLLEIGFRLIQKAVVVKRSSTAELHRRNCHLEAGIFQHSDRGARRGGMKMVVECICPKDYGGLVCVQLRPICPPCSKRLRSKRGNAPFRSDVCHSFCDAVEERCGRNQIDETRSNRRQPSPHLNHSE